MRRLDAGCGLAVLAREVCEDVVIVSFSDRTCVIAPRRGFALRDAIVRSQTHGGTYLGRALDECRKVAGVDRTIVITDEQSHDRVGEPIGKGYLINVASNKYGVGYGNWVHIDGWSESAVKFIREVEKDAN
jgi:60 kDa SS-A/Ro ribonucleoprotein